MLKKGIFALLFLFPFFAFSSPQVSLENASFDELKKDLKKFSHQMERSWYTILRMGKSHPKSSKSYLKSLLKDRRWYIRSAALKALSKHHRKETLLAAKVLMDDPALIVRAGAVEVVKELGGKELSSYLWKKLYSSENFRKGKSLWIRKKIVEALASFSQEKDIENFVRVLTDKDQRLYPSAISAIQKKRNINFSEGVSLNERRLGLIHQMTSEGIKL